MLSCYLLPKLMERKMPQQRALRHVHERHTIHFYSWEERPVASNKDPRVHRGYALSNHGRRCTNGRVLPQLGVIDTQTHREIQSASCA